MTAKLEGQTVIVTGGGRGYGMYMAYAIAREGASVVLTSRTLDECEEAVATIAGEGGSALAVQCDVADRGQVEAMVEQTRAAFGSVDVLINNAGYPGSVADVFSIDRDSWDTSFAVNVTGSYLCAQAVLTDMRERGAGHIVNVTSRTARPDAPTVRSITYTVSKYAVDGLTHVLARRLKEHGIRVNAFSPGLAETRFLSNMPAGYLSGRECQTTDHVMEPIIHLLTDDIGTGVIFDVRAWLREVGLYDKYTYVHD